MTAPDLTVLSREELGAAMELLSMMLGPIQDGGHKRRNGSKPLKWMDEPDHVVRMWNHIRRYEQGVKLDPETGRRTLAYVGVRALMAAWQEDHGQAPV